MDTTDRLPDMTIKELLGRGGLIVSHQEDSPAPSAVLLPFKALRDPAASEQLGRELARALQKSDPTALLIWQDPQEIVLGFVVGRELRVPVVRSYDRDGLVDFDGVLAKGGRLALVADAFREAEPVRAMCALARQQGQQVVAAGALVSMEGRGLDELRSQAVPLITLLDFGAVHRNREV